MIINKSTQHRKIIIIFGLFPFSFSLLGPLLLPSLDIVRKLPTSIALILQKEDFMRVSVMKCVKSVKWCRGCTDLH